MASSKISIKKRKARTGRLFILPFTIGVIFFFIQPIALSFYYSFTNITTSKEGFVFHWSGLENFKDLFTKDVDFLPTLVANVRSMLTDVPVIILFSMFIAVILNQKFKGRTFTRAVFFLPVIVSSGIIISILYQDVFNQSIQAGSAQASYIFNSSGLNELMITLNLPQFVIDSVTRAISGIFDMLWRTGVQILIFLSAMQNIPTQLYEASKVEGATSWENFWKITFPMVSPLILVNVIYTIIDTFTNYLNPVMNLIYREGIVNLRYSYGSAMSWVYLAVVITFISVVYFLVSRIVFYRVDN